MATPRSVADNGGVGSIYAGTARGLPGGYTYARAFATKVPADRVCGDLASAARARCNGTTKPGEQQQDDSVWVGKRRAPPAGRTKMARRSSSRFGDPTGPPRPAGRAVVAVG